MTEFMNEKNIQDEEGTFTKIVRKTSSFFKAFWEIISYKKIVLIAIIIFTTIILFAAFGPYVLRGPYEPVRAFGDKENVDQFVSTQNFLSGEVDQFYNISGDLPQKLQNSNATSFNISGTMLVWTFDEFDDLKIMEGNCLFTLWRGNLTTFTMENDMLASTTVSLNDISDNYEFSFELESTEQNLESQYVISFAYLGNSDFTSGEIIYTLETTLIWYTYELQLQVLQPPSHLALSGTDPYGYDAFAQLSHAARNSLKVGFFAGITATTVAVIIGAVAGYLGKNVDEFTQLIVNIFLVFPVFPLLIIMAAFVENRSLFLVSVIIASISWPWATRAIRAQILSLKERDFVRLAKISGKNGFTIAIKELLPNMASYILLIFAVQVGSAIGAEAGISLLGFGPDPKKHITLGTMLFWVVADQHIQSNIWWLYLPPGLILTILFVILYILQSNLDELFNPRLRAK